MKNLLIILFIFAFLNQAQASDYSNYCSTNIAKKTFSGNLASISGSNLLTRNIIEKSLETAIKKETDAKFNIKIKNFYGTNILNGEFKSIIAKTKKYEHDGIFLSETNIQTICPYNHIKYKDENLYFLENMVLKFETNLTKEDIKNTLNSQKINHKIANILSNVSNYSAIFPILNKFKPISISIKIDERNKGKLKLTKIEKIDENLRLSGFIIIQKQ